jgi:hypothetical protein
VFDEIRHPAVDKARANRSINPSLDPLSPAKGSGIQGHLAALKRGHRRRPFNPRYTLAASGLP